MKCLYSNYCDVCGHKNEEQCNTCHLGAIHIECAYLETAGMNMTRECSSCERYIKNNGVQETGAFPALDLSIGFIAIHVDHIIDKIKKLFK
jgi:hypothetical protein